MTGSRVCPQCQAQTDHRRCPKDGYATVPRARLDEGLDPLVGQVFDKRYRVESLLGRGGMGAVYRAVQLAVGRPVALKVLRPEYSGSLDQSRRFQNEARAVSLLKHPSSVRLIDFGQSEAGDLYLVMELLEGEPLSHRLRRNRRLPVMDVVRIGLQALRALGEAHELGIVHRDIKPDNIFLMKVRGEPDLVKVLDFGIARLARAEGASEGLQSLTRTGDIIGTPAYMSPEQAQGLRVDARTDLYSLAVVLFQALAGKTPFEGDTPFSLLLKHVEAVPPLLSAAADGRGLSPALVEAVDRALAKDPAARFATADEMAAALSACLAELEAGPPALMPGEGDGETLVRGRIEQRSRTRRLAVAGGLAVLAAVVAASVFGARSLGTDTPLAGSRDEPAPAAPAASAAGPEVPPVARRVAAVASRRAAGSIEAVAAPPPGVAAPDAASAAAPAPPPGEDPAPPAAAALVTAPPAPVPEPIRVAPRRPDLVRPPRSPAPKAQARPEAWDLR